MAQMLKIRRKMWWVFLTIFIFFRSRVLYATEMEHKRSISFGIIWSEYLGEQISSLNAIRVLAPLGIGVNENGRFSPQIEIRSDSIHS